VPFPKSALIDLDHRASFADLLVKSALSLSEETSLESFVESEQRLKALLQRSFGEENKYRTQPALLEGSLRAADGFLGAKPRARALARRWVLGLLKNRRAMPADAAGRYAIAIPLLVRGRAGMLADLTDSLSTLFKQLLERVDFSDVQTLARPTPFVTSGRLRQLDCVDMLSLFCGELANDDGIDEGLGSVQLLYYMVTAGGLPTEYHAQTEGSDAFVSAANDVLAASLPDGVSVQAAAPVFPGFAAAPTITPAYGEYVEASVRTALSAAGHLKSPLVVVRTHRAGYVEVALQSPELPEAIQLTAPEVYCEPAAYVLEFCGVAAVNAGAQVRCEDEAWPGAPASLQ